MNNGILEVTKVFAVCACPDTLARSALQNHIRFNGFYGCSWCLHPSKFVQNQVRYIIMSEPNPLRSDQAIRENAITALQTGSAVNGVRGPSSLFNLPGFNQALGYVPDYMHCVCLGVAKMMADLWFSTRSHAESYYIGQRTSIMAINAHLLKIRPPRAITRLPHPITARKEWKASEWRAWLLFYCLPCLTGLLETRFLVHFLLLSSAIYLLIQENITLHDIEKKKQIYYCWSVWWLVKCMERKS